MLQQCPIFITVTQFVSADGRCAGGGSPSSVSGNASFGSFDAHKKMRQQIKKRQAHACRFLHYLPNPIFCFINSYFSFAIGTT